MEPQPESSEPVRVRPEPAPTRPGLVVIAALLTELVVIGAAANQWVTVRVARSRAGERDPLTADVKASLLTFHWRFAPQTGDTTHIWLSQVLLILATLVLTAVFVAVIVRGPASFARVFLTSWLAVIAAGMLGAIARGLVNENNAGSSGSRLQRALFGPLGPNSISFFATVVLGLVVAAVAATVTMVRTTRPESEQAIPPDPVVPPYVPPEQPPPFNPVPRPGPSASAGAPTAAFPRPPDDDDLGHDNE